MKGPSSTSLHTRTGESGISIELPDELLDAITERVAERLADRQPEQDGWLRGADRIAEYIDAPRSRVFALSSAGRIPVERDGSSLIARKSALDAWIRNGGARRP